MTQPSMQQFATRSVENFHVEKKVCKQVKKVVRIIPDPHLRFGFAHEIDLCCCYSTVLYASSFDADLNANLFSVLLDRLWSLWFGALDFFLKKNEKTEENFHFSCMSPKQGSMNGPVWNMRCGAVHKLCRLGRGVKNLQIYLVKR